jgi:branched-chain amino acid transport system substrate-binding protein
MVSQRRVSRSWSRRAFLKATGLGLWVLCGPGSASSAQANEIRIGVLAPQQVPLPVGQALIRAAHIAVDEINAAGGMTGRPVTIKDLVRDDLDLNRVRANFEELIAEKRVHAVIGGFLDESIQAILPALERFAQNKQMVPFLNTGSAGPQFTLHVRNNYNIYKYYFRVMINTDVLTQDVANMAVNLISVRLGLKNFALLVEDGDFGRTFQVFMENKLKGANLNVVFSQRFDLNLSNFEPIVEQIRRARAEVIIPAFARHNGVGFVQALANGELAVPVLGINVDGQAFEYFERTQSKCESHVYIDAATDATAITPKTLPFFRSYVAKRASGEPSRPLYTAYTTYDAFYILKSALEQTQGETDPDKLVTALEATDYVGTLGTIRFRDRNDQYPHEPIYSPELVAAKWTQWRRHPRGEVLRTVLYPDEYRTSSFIAAGLLESVASRLQEKDSIDGAKLSLDLSGTLTAEAGAFPANAPVTVNALTADRKADPSKSVRFTANADGSGTVRLAGFTINEDTLVRVTVGTNGVNVVARK